MTKLYAAKKQPETGEGVREYKKIALNTSTKTADSGKMDLKHPTNPVTDEQYVEFISVQKGGVSNARVKNARKR